MQFAKRATLRLPPMATVPLVDCAPLLCFRKHNRAAVQVREEVKKMVQLPMLKQRPPGAGRRLFGVPLLELGELGLGAAGVPLVVSSMVEFLREHGQ